MKIKSLILLTIATLCCTALSAKVITTVNIKDSIQAGETYLFIDKLVNTEGNYSYTFDRSSESKPDSTINLSLKTFVPKQNIAVAYKDSIVEGETYLFIDQLLTEGGEYTATIARKAVPGDSTIALTLSLMPNCQDTMVAIADSIIDGEMYLFIDTLLTTEGTYYRTLPRVAGCDSTIALTLSLMPACSDTAVAYTDSIFVGESYLFIDTLITMNNADTVTCQRTLPRVAGCDSTINLTLIARYVYTRDTLRDTISDSLCYKEAFTDRLGVTYYPAQDTVVMDTISDVRVDTVDYTITTYDSIYRYELKVWPEVVDMPIEYDTILVDSLPYNWKTYQGVSNQIYAAGTYFDTAFNQLDCDSIRYELHLEVIAHDTVTLPVTKNLCNGEVYETRLQIVAPVTEGDTVFNDTVPGIMMTPLHMRDSIYAYTLTVWPATKYPTAVKDTIDEDKWPYIWNVYKPEVGDSIKETITTGGQHEHHRKNILDCDSIVYKLDLAVRTVVTRYATPVDTNVCKGTDYVGRLTTHTINGLTEWQDSLRLREGLTAIDSIYQYKVDTLPTKIPDSEISHIKAFCDYPVDYSYAELNVDEFMNPYFIFAEITDTIWEVETKAGWKPAATTIITSEDESVRVRVTVITECETTVSTSEPYEVKIATAADKPELEIKAAQKYGNRIIMIDRNDTEAKEWTIPASDITWYKVVGTRDDHRYTADPTLWDDQIVKEGLDYYTLADGSPLSGSYYAIIATAMKPGMICGADLSTPTIVCENVGPQAPSLAPNLVAPNESMILSGLDATQNYTIRVIGLDGSAVNTLNVNGNEKINLKAAPVQGMYIVNVWNGQENVSLKYIVK